MSALPRPGVVLAIFAVLGARVAHAQPETGERTNINIVPVVGGNSDIGLALGAVGVIERLEAGRPGERVGPDLPPYRWQVAAGAITSFKTGGELRSPFQDVYASLLLPGLAGGALRLEVRPSYTQESALEYHGLGNASERPANDDAARGYSRIHPTLAARARLRLLRNVFLRVGNVLTINAVDVRASSKLAQDRSSGSATVRDALAGPDEHAVYFAEHVLVYDDRDLEASAQRGQHHHLLLRLSPGGTDAFPYRYGQANITLRGYRTAIPRLLTFAARAVIDAQFGDPPFYELARFAEDTYAIGGSKGVRGVPAQRYYGKLKVFGNLEARTRFTRFRLLGKPWELGAVGFLDGGRLWADYTPNPGLDGSGLGLKFGVGGGLRLYQGQTFALRSDAAYSPDARPIGFYFEVGEVF